VDGAVKVVRVAGRVVASRNASAFILDADRLIA
jgi:hypothetical protein